MRRIASAAAVLIAAVTGSVAVSSPALAQTPCTAAALIPAVTAANSANGTVTLTRPDRSEVVEDKRRGQLLLRFALASLTAIVAVVGCSAAATHPPAASWPVTSLHYASNDNFSRSGQYLPAADGFNLADVGSNAKKKLGSLPVGVRAMVWLGYCGGATAAFRSAVDAFAGDPRVYGFYMMDEPTPSTCPAADLLAEDNWIHAHVPGAKTFAILPNLGRAAQPNFAGSYTPRDSGLDLIGLDPYPVRSELLSPDYAEIAEYVQSAEAIGWPESSIVPVYQAFGGGNYPDDDNGYWVLPTAAQEREILAAWASVIPHPQFDYAYSWGSQKRDTALSQSPALRAVFSEKNPPTALAGSGRGTGMSPRGASPGPA